MEYGRGTGWGTLRNMNSAPTRDVPLMKKGASQFIAEDDLPSLR
jgi:hypothetical protein